MQSCRVNSAGRPSFDQGACRRRVKEHFRSNLAKNIYNESTGMKMNSPLRLFVLLVLFALCVLAKEGIGNTASSGNTTDNVIAHTIKDSGHEKTKQPCPEVRRDDHDDQREDTRESPYRERGMSRTVTFFDVKKVNLKGDDGYDYYWHNLR
ncbi:unnamed protein product [Haemonchus placei]|uniref:Uncharacterized protein n=1 Tax=Haemonchus placei TaxID=6290 RepID=A0A0N4WPR6_HAEPC|nr:unnamed protein product [Haemonchus placei]